MKGSGYMNTKQHLIQVPDVQKVGIYAIHNKTNGKYYVGSSVNINSRMKSHRSNMEKLNGSNLKFYEDLNNEEDIKNFEFIVLETFEDYQITDWELRKKEAEYIEKYDAYNGYNNPNRTPTMNGYFGDNEYLFCKKQQWKKQKKLSVSEVETMGNLELLHFYASIIPKARKMKLDVEILENEILKRMSK